MKTLDIVVSTSILAVLLLLADFAFFLWRWLSDTLTIFPVVGSFIFAAVLSFYLGLMVMWEVEE